MSKLSSFLSTMRGNNDSLRKTPSRRGKSGRNPSQAYRGEQTYKHVYQAIYKAANATPAGYVETVNFGSLDNYSVLQQQWATWRITSFTVHLFPGAPQNGAYSARPFEALDGIPVVPTDLATVLDGGGFLRAATNSYANSIRLNWKSKQIASQAYTSTASLTNDNFGDPGFMFFVDATDFIIYAQVDVVFEFREPVQLATMATVKELTAPIDPDFCPDEEFEDEPVLLSPSKVPHKVIGPPSKTKILKA